MNKVLVLEDDPRRIAAFRRNFVGLPYTVDYAETAQEAIELLRDSLGTNNIYYLLCLDHDLGGEIYVRTDVENTGSTVARWLRDNVYGNGMAGSALPYILIHSLNTSAVDYMLTVLPNAHRVPFLWTEEVFNRTIKG